MLGMGNRTGNNQEAACQVDTLPGQSPIPIAASRQNPVKVSLLLACHW